MEVAPFLSDVSGNNMDIPRESLKIMKKQMKTAKKKKQKLLIGQTTVRTDKGQPEKYFESESTLESRTLLSYKK